VIKGASVVALTCLVAPARCIAGGTVGLSEIDTLLRQKPALRDFLKSSLDLNDTVMAAIRFGPQFEHLSGGRIGPYMIEARPKGSIGGRTLEVVLCTDARFLDDTGTVVEVETTATYVQENLTAVMIREIASMPAIPTCPDK
jgi:Ran GTPase-activating protein (RanGAP) involved in mRNA processing and transport